MLLVELISYLISFIGFMFLVLGLSTAVLILRRIPHRRKQCGH